MLGALSLVVIAACDRTPTQNDVPSASEATTPLFLRPIPWTEGKPPKAFLDAGCTADKDDLDCKGVAAIEKFKCSNLVARAWLDDLEPKLPIVQCMYAGRSAMNLAPKGDLPGVGCMYHHPARYIVLHDDQFKAIDTTAEFLKTFAPVESEREAVAFATALSEGFAGWKLDLAPAHKRLLPKIQPTRVEKKGEAFIAHMFEHDACGCRRHMYYTATFEVTTAGAVKRKDKTPAFYDPNQDKLCVD